MDNPLHEGSQEANPSGTVALVLEGITGVLNLPKAAIQNVTKALAHLGTVPVAFLDGKALEIKANSESRALLTKAVGKELARRATEGVTLEMGEIALHAHASKILRQQTNLGKIVQKAALELNALPAPATSAVDTPRVEEISEDWLNSFESEAANMSSEQMQLLFGKILAGEIACPSTFSIRTIKLMGQMDTDVAANFRMLCALAVSHQIGRPRSVIAAGAITFHPGKTSLHDFGMTASRLDVLEEYGLIVSAPHKEPYFFSVYDETTKQVQIPLTYMKRNYILTPKEPKTAADFKHYGSFTVRFTRVGRELLNVVDADENQAYTKTLQSYFGEQGLTIEELPTSEGA